MTIVARRIASTPVRTAAETWNRIVTLISNATSLGRQELDAVGGIAASVIADEIPKEAPVVVTGNGPRLRVYCVYGEDAVIGDDCDEAELSWIPAEGEWRLFLPCAKEDLEWIRNALQQRSTRIVAYDAKKGTIPSPESESEGRVPTTISVNVTEFLKK